MTGMMFWNYDSPFKVKFEKEAIAKEDESSFTNIKEQYR